MVLGSAMDFGWLISGSSIESIPLNERYYTGGQGTIRGFDYKKVGPLNSKGIPTGGLIKWVWRITELRFPIHKSLYGAIFADSGNCWNSSHAFRFSDFRQAAGLGLRLHSFLGIVRVDYAWKLDRRSGEKAGAWVFNMGHAF